MSRRPRRPNGSTETRYEFGFRGPDGVIVTCVSVQEAKFFADRGGRMMFREVKTYTGGWEEIAPLEKGGSNE